MTTSGPRSLISSIARSSRLGTKCGPPQCTSEMCAIRKQSSCIESQSVEPRLSILGRPFVVQRNRPKEDLDVELRPGAPRVRAGAHAGDERRQRAFLERRLDAL